MKRISLLIAVMMFLPFCFAQTGQKKQSVMLSDSVVKADKDFYYIHSLDSLLKVMNAEQDSISRQLKEESGEVKKQNRFLSAFFKSTVVRIFFWIALFGFIGFILYKVFNIQLTGKKEIAAKADEFPDDELLKPESWYLKEIHRAESENDFITAIRSRFMRLLALMDDRKMIEFLPGKTNAAYAGEIKDTSFKTDFRQVSMVYEYVWYGRKELSADQYASLKPLFEKTEKHI